METHGMLDGNRRAIVKDVLRGRQLSMSLTFWENAVKWF